MLRAGFDPARPLVATSAFNDVAAGGVFDWRARGIPEIDAVSMFQAGLLTHPPALDLPGVTSAELAAKVEQADRSSKSRSRAR